MDRAYGTLLFVFLVNNGLKPVATILSEATPLVSFYFEIWELFHGLLVITPTKAGTKIFGIGTRDTRAPAEGL
jgi:hypothetical protein